MPTSLPARVVEVVPKVSPSAFIAVFLVFAVLIVMTLHVPFLDQVEASSADRGAAMVVHRI